MAVTAPLNTALLEKIALFHKQVAQFKIRTYKPYPWQAEFHAAGKDYPERMLMAANRVGKTQCAAAEVAYHLTGDYPDWWAGKRFDRPTLVWTGSPTNETSRDIVQAELLGGLGEKLGTGWVPRVRIVGTPKTRQAGVKDVIDTFAVRHKSGGLSSCNLKTYEQGWSKWQGTAPHVVWNDEEPDDYMIYSEAQTRVLTSHGILMTTFTPLRGITELVEHFRTGAARENSGIYLKGATWADAPHLSPEDRAAHAARYRSHERKARTEGIPMMGEGAIFPIDDDLIVIDPFHIPAHFARIKGCDFGFEHCAAGVELAHDRDQDILYLIDSYKKEGELAPYHAAWFNKSNKWVPVAWPHDGLNTDKAGGGTVKDAYALHGVNMMSKSARYPRVAGQDEKAGPQPQWPIIDQMRERMMTGRFKVFSTQQQWLEEKRNYHVKANATGEMKPVSRNDDLLKATFYAAMMLRYAIAPAAMAYREQLSAPQNPIASTRV